MSLVDTTHAGAWSDEGYLQLNGDVAHAGVAAFEHYKNHGHKEGRKLAAHLRFVYRILLYDFLLICT